MKVIPSDSFCEALDWRCLDKATGEGILAIIPDASLVKTASAGVDVLATMKAFVSALETVSVKTGIPLEQIAGLAKAAAAPVTAESKDETVRIASKSVKDSHYFIDVSIDPVSKKDKSSNTDRSLIMVSCLLREGYLGRYMIKRNFFYLPSNSSEAESTYDELVRKARRVKSRYLAGQNEPYDIMPEVKAFLDGIRGDFESIAEDVLATNIRRDRETYHETAGPSYIRQA